MASRDVRRPGAKTRVIPRLHEQVTDARISYVQKGGQDRNVTADFLKTFHSLVTGYYMALRTYRTNKEIKGLWHEAEVVRPIDGVAFANGQIRQAEIHIPESVTGIDRVGFFIGAETTVTKTLNRSNSASQTTTVPVYLSGDALLRVSSVLDEVANGLNMIDQPDTQGRSEENLPQVDLDEDGDE